MMHTVRSVPLLEFFQMNMHHSKRKCLDMTTNLYSKRAKKRNHEKI